MQFVTYLRVSTERWGQSGLGLEARRAAVAAHVLGRGEVAAEFVEVESGKRAYRANRKLKRFHLFMRHILRP